MANKKTRKRNTKKIDKELNQLLKEKNKIDDLTEVKKKTTKKKETIVTPERKKKTTTKKKDAVVVPERRSVKSKKKAQARRVIVNQEEKKTIKHHNKKKVNPTSSNSLEDTKSKKIKARAVIVKPDEKEKIKQYVEPDKPIIVENLEYEPSFDDKEVISTDEMVEDVVNSYEEVKEENHELEVTHEVIPSNEFVSENSVSEEVDSDSFEEQDVYEGRHQEIVDEDEMIVEEPFQEIGEEHTSVTYSTYKPSSIDSTMELFHDDEFSDTSRRLQVLEGEMRDLYDKSFEEVPIEEEKVAEESGVLVFDSAIVDHDEKPVRKRNALTIITVILFIIFMLLFIAFIAFVIYVCTY